MVPSRVDEYLELLMVILFSIFLIAEFFSYYTTISTLHEGIVEQGHYYAGMLQDSLTWSCTVPVLLTVAAVSLLGVLRNRTIGTLDRYSSAFPVETLFLLHSYRRSLIRLELAVSFMYFCMTPFVVSLCALFPPKTKFPDDPEYLLGLIRFLTLFKLVKKLVLHFLPVSIATTVRYIDIVRAAYNTMDAIYKKK